MCHSVEQLGFMIFDIHVEVGKLRQGHVEVGKCLENTNSALPDIPQDVKLPQSHTV